MCPYMETQLHAWIDTTTDLVPRRSPDQKKIVTSQHTVLGSELGVPAGWGSPKGFTFPRNTLPVQPVPLTTN